MDVTLAALICRIAGTIEVLMHKNPLDGYELNLKMQLCATVERYCKIQDINLQIAIKESEKILRELEKNDPEGA